MKKLADWLQTGVFLLFLVLGLLLLLLLPDREFSEQENRYLAKPPRFRFTALLSGDFTRDAEDCITDQFPLRDGWISLTLPPESGIIVRAIDKTPGSCFRSFGKPLDENSPLME